MKAPFTAARFLIMLLAIPLFAQHNTVDQRPPSTEVTIDGIDLAEAGSDHVGFQLSMHATATRNIKARRICFEGMRVGGVPVYMGAIEGPFDLTGGVPAPLPMVPLTVYFRDLDSLSPIIHAVSDGGLTIDGHARVEFDLSFFQKIALRQWSGRTDVAVHQGVPLAVPGGELGRLAASTALRAADMALQLAGSTLSTLRRTQADWTGALSRDYAPALVLAESRYSLLMDDGRRLDMTLDGVGFGIPDGKFVLTGEMLAPWKFNPEVAAMLQSQQARLIPESIELLVWPGDVSVESGTARSLAQGQLRVVNVKDAEETMEMPMSWGVEKVRVAKRDSGRNFATLQFTSQEQARRVLPIAPNDDMQNESWDRVALFRFSDKGRPEIAFTPAHRDGKRLILDTSMDESAFGSPVITPRGAVAMVQDEHSGMMLNHLF